MSDYQAFSVEYILCQSQHEPYFPVTPWLNYSLCGIYSFSASFPKSPGRRSLKNLRHLLLRLFWRHFELIQIINFMNTKLTEKNQSYSSSAGTLPGPGSPVDWTTELEFWINLLFINWFSISSKSFTFNSRYRRMQFFEFKDHRLAYKKHVHEIRHIAVSLPKKRI